MPNRWTPDSFTQEEIDELRARAAAQLLKRRAEPLHWSDLVIVERVVDERLRQIIDEGWTHKHDDEHVEGQLALAAASYAEPPELRALLVEIADGDERGVPYAWPWDSAWWKPDDDRLREIVKATALLLAEGARILRQRAT